jgi:hypothetical protein
MSSLPLMRTEYWNMSQNPPIPRSGSTAHGESITDMENYLLPVSQTLVSSFYTGGVAEGLTVSAVSGQAGLTIAPGVALDAAGHIIALAASGVAVVDPNAGNQVQGVATVPVTQNGLVFATAGIGGDFLLTLTWREVLNQGQVGNAPVLLHAPWLRLTAVAGFQDDQQVVLARVSLDNAGLVTGLSVGITQADGSIAPGRRSLVTQGIEVALRVAASAGLSVGDVTVGTLLARDSATLELAAGQGSVSVVARSLSVRAANDAQGTHGIQLDATASTLTAGTVQLGGAQSGVSLSSGPTAGQLGITATRLAVLASNGTEQISLDGTTSTVGTSSVLVGGAVSVSAASGGVLALMGAATPVHLGVGTTTPRNAVGIRGVAASEELISFEDTTGATKWHVNQKLGGQPGLNFAETLVADGRLFLKAGGKGVGIGTTTPGFELEVNGTVCAHQFCNPSDLRLKRDITPLTGVLDRLAGIRAVSYRPRRPDADERSDADARPDADERPRPQIGVLAQEVQAAFPELVVETGPDGLKAVDYAGLSGVLVGAMHELLASNAALSARLSELERLMSAPLGEEEADRGAPA